MSRSQPASTAAGVRSPSLSSVAVSSSRSGESAEPVLRTLKVYVTVWPAIPVAGPVLVRSTEGWKRLSVWLDVEVTLTAGAPWGWYRTFTMLTSGSGASIGTVKFRENWHEAPGTRVAQAPGATFVRLPMTSSMMPDAASITRVVWPLLLIVKV